MSNKEQLSKAIAKFSWGFSTHWFLEVGKLGNYVWSDPDYGGDNTLTKYNGGHRSWVNECNIPFSRDKGHHIIGQKCGDFTLVSPTLTKDALLIAQRAIADWVNTYAPEHCHEARVKEARERIAAAGGTLAYLASVNQIISEALKG